MLISGPVLEVLVEVEMARDGALLIRPREHTGVSLNRQVMMSIGVENQQDLYKLVDEYQPSQFSPAQPNTYSPVLEQIAIQLRGNFVTSDATSSSGNLCISAAWCLYTRAKPSSVWERDALALAEAELDLPLAVWSLTHGPAAMEQAWNASSGGVATAGCEQQWWTQPFRTTPAQKPKRATILPLPASELQNRVAEFLLHKNYPAVVCEGPPGKPFMFLRLKRLNPRMNRNGKDADDCQHHMRLLV